MKLAEIPRLMDWIKTLPQQWVDDPESWQMENFYIVRPDGIRAGEAGTLRLALREKCGGNKDHLVRTIKMLARAFGAAAVVHATEGWILKFNKDKEEMRIDEIMEASGPDPEAEAARRRLGVERIHALTIMAQTNEETLIMSVRAYENPKAIGEVLQEATISNSMEGTFANLLKWD